MAKFQSPWGDRNYLEFRLSVPLLLGQQPGNNQAVALIPDRHLMNGPETEPALIEALAGCVGRAESCRYSTALTKAALDFHLQGET